MIITSYSYGTGQPLTTDYCKVTLSCERCGFALSAALNTPWLSERKEGSLFMTQDAMRRHDLECK